MADDEEDLFPIAVLIDELKTDDTQVSSRLPRRRASKMTRSGRSVPFGASCSRALPPHHEARAAGCGSRRA